MGSAVQHRPSVDGKAIQRFEAVHRGSGSNRSGKDNPLETQSNFLQIKSFIKLITDSRKDEGNG